MTFSKAHISYSNTLCVLYMCLRVRHMVSGVWYGIKNVLEKLPVEQQVKLLKEWK
ncbi:hypothetical protein ACO1GT_00475 [Staphylococcus arlettae]